MQLADSLVARVEAGAPNSIEQDARFVRSRIRLGRGDLPGAHEDSARALELGRQGGYPEMLIPALALGARVLQTTGRPDEAAPLVDELLSLWPESCPTSYWVADVVFTLDALGRLPRLIDAAGGVRTPSRWLDAAVAAAPGDFLRAAEVYAAIGSAPDEAEARFRAARALAEEGRRDEAEAQLVRALEVFRRLGADSYVREGETLLAPRAGPASLPGLP